MERKSGNAGKIKEIDLHEFLRIVRSVYYENKRFTVKEVARRLDVSEPTLRKNYIEYLNRALEQEDRERVEMELVRQEK